MRQRICRRRHRRRRIAPESGEEGRGTQSVSDTTILVRLGTVEDYPKAHEVIAETFAFPQQAVPEFFHATDSPPPTRNVIEELLRDGRGAWFVAEHEGRIVGFITIRLQPPAHEPFMV